MHKIVESKDVRFNKWTLVTHVKYSTFPKPIDVDYSNFKWFYYYHVLLYCIQGRDYGDHNIIYIRDLI